MQAVYVFVKIMITKEVTNLRVLEGDTGGFGAGRGNYTKKGWTRQLPQLLASDSQKESDEQFPFPNSMAELQSSSAWPRSLISLFLRDVSFWPSSPGQNLSQFRDECAWIFLVLSVLTTSVVLFFHVISSILSLPCLALCRRLASIPVVEAFCYLASCWIWPLSGGAI